MEKVSEYANLEFKWLEKKCLGGKNKEVQFYKSFIYDGVKYTLYDCVYMYKEGIEEPFIGKLAKMWERPDKLKKIKVHWFFRPEEISTWLGETKTLQNEILFASGEGVGLANVNPLEAIAGPCNVVCISKDSRNPQPSDDELKAADFVFYRTFDVQSCTILDKMDNEVGGINIKDVFNRKDGENISPFPNGTSDRKEENPNTTIPNEQHQPLTITKPNKLKGAAKDESQDKDNPSLLKRNMTPTGYDKLEDRPSKKLEPDGTSDRKEENPNTTIPNEQHQPLTITIPNKLKGATKDESQGKVNPNLLKRNMTPTGYDELQDRPLKKLEPDDKKSTREKHDEPEVAQESKRLADMPSKKTKPESSTKLPVDDKSKHEKKSSLNVNNFKSVRTSGANSEIGKTDKADNAEANKRNKSPTGSDKLPDRPFKKLKSDDKKPLEKQVEVPRDSQRLMDTSSKKPNIDSKSRHEDKLPADVSLRASKISSTTKTQKNVKTSVKVTDDLEGSIIKKTRDDCAPKMTDIKKVGSNTNGSNRKELVANSGSFKEKTKLVLALDSHGANRELKEDQSDDGESKWKLSVSKSFKVPTPSTDRNKKSVYQEFECGPKPNIESSSWFKRLPWEDRLKNAYDQGTAILLHNVDPNYTSEEVEDIIWHAFTEYCEAKVLQRTAVSSQQYAQALILLRTKEAAQKVLRKLNEDCLMLVTYGRPLVGTRCPPLPTKKNSKFFGHLVVDKARFQNNREDEAVSTSHFSQPNTIEYDMAMEWCLLQSRSKKFWKAFHKQQEGELKKLLSDLNRK